MHRNWIGVGWTYANKEDKSHSYPETDQIGMEVSLNIISTSVVIYRTEALLAVQIHSSS